MTTLYAYMWLESRNRATPRIPVLRFRLKVKDRIEFDFTSLFGFTYAGQQAAEEIPAE